MQDGFDGFGYLKASQPSWSGTCVVQKLVEVPEIPPAPLTKLVEARAVFGSLQLVQLRPQLLSHRAR
mgnify:CR=1 FL=1